LQGKVDDIIAAFKEKLTNHYEEQAEATLGDDLGPAERKKAIASIVKKQMGDVMDHVRVVKNNAYAFIEWDKEYAKKEEEAKVWAKLSVPHATKRSRDN
jgi:hypothetical protein